MTDPIAAPSIAQLIRGWLEADAQLGTQIIDAVLYHTPPAVVEDAVRDALPGWGPPPDVPDTPTLDELLTDYFAYEYQNPRAFAESIGHHVDGLELAEIIAELRSLPHAQA